MDSSVYSKMIDGLLKGLVFWAIILFLGGVILGLVPFVIYLLVA